MKDFAVSSITYYDLAREKVMNKYPRLISILMILTLICMTGLAIFLISDLVSFASNPDHKGVLVGLDFKGLENGIVSTTNGTQKSSLALENLSRQTIINASSPSSKAANEVIAASKSSSSSSPVKKHHSSSSSSSSSSAVPAKKSMNNSNASEVKPIQVPASLSSVAAGDIANLTKGAYAKVPVSVIKFKTEATFSLKSDPGQKIDGAAASDNSNSQSTKASLQKSKVTASSRAQKVQEIRSNQIANRNRMVGDMKKKAAQLRAKAASK